MTYFVTKRGGTPYGGPSWHSIRQQPRWFENKEEAEFVANLLTMANPVGFSVEEIPEYCKAGSYPIIIQIDD